MKTKKLHQHFLKCENVCTDTRKIQRNDMFFALKGENFNGNTFAEEAIKKDAKYVVIDEVEYQNKQTILVNNVLETLQELASFHRTYLNIPIIAITGSNGKTTTKELINTVLSKKLKTVATIGNLNNHIGVPLTLLSMNKETEIGIVEMGANHLKEIEFLCNIAKPDFGYITNFGKAHLEGFGSIKGVIKAKSELYDYLIKNNKYIFLNADDSIQKEKLNSYIKKFGFSEHDSEYYKIEFLEANPFVKLKIEDTTISSKLIGNYNFINICAAIIIGKYFNVKTEDIKKGIETYIPDNNRSQIITKGTNKIILDAYNANPTSMKAALLNFSILRGKHKIAILGDMFELGQESKIEHENITKLANSFNFDSTILVGENFEAANTEGLESYLTFEDFKQAFKNKSINNSTLLIKGSRGMALERILDLL
jgi:UDP-N-acetylmuramoyl-tripeptide--D-alanyl-D-alanine ligase